MTHRPSLRPFAMPRLRAMACALAVVASCGAAMPALAAPDANDPVLRLLQERGLIDSAAAAPNTATTNAAPATPSPATDASPGFMQQVRDKASDLVLASMNFLGVPYRRGGSSAESGFDCSGFTRYVFEMSLGRVLPRRAEEQAQAKDMLQVARDELKPGDLVFFNTLKRTFSHVGIYVGDNKFIHAPRSGGAVRVEDMRIAYWTQRYNGARRVADAAPDATVATKSATATTAKP